MNLQKLLISAAFSLAALNTTAALAQNLSDIFGETKPSSADLQLDVKGHGKGGAFLNVKEFAGSKVSGVFNSGIFVDNPVNFTATVDGNKLQIKTSKGHTVLAMLKKQADGTYLGDFTGDFSGSVKLVMK